MSDENNVLVKTTLRMSDGRILEGVVILALGGVLERTLNNDDAKVIQFRDDDGKRLITKAYIVEAQEH